MPERLNPLEFTIITREVPALSAVRRSLGAQALVDVVVGLRVPGTQEIMSLGYTPDGKEAEHSETWEESQAHNLRAYYEANYVTTSDTPVDCFGMLDAVMGWDSQE